MQTAHRHVRSQHEKNGSR